MKPIFIIILGVLLSIDASAIERELYGIRLGSDYHRTRQMLAGKYGPPMDVERDSGSRDSFRLGDGTNNTITIGGDREFSGYVEWVALSGSREVRDLRFVGNINLGLSEEAAAHLLVGASRTPDARVGYRRYAFSHTNYSVQFRDQILSTIRIDLSNAHVKQNDTHTELLIFSANEMAGLANGKPIAELLQDDLAPYCRLRYPIRCVNGLFLVDVTVAGKETGNGGAFTFLLDTGWSGGAISRRVYRQIGPKSTQAGDGDTELPEGTDGTIGFGPERFHFDAFDLVDSPLLDDLGVDGVLGSGLFFSGNIILNLQREYICFPKISLDGLAGILGFRRIEAAYTGGGIWVDFLADNHLLGGYFLDTGANVTSLLPEDIDALNLNYRAINRHATIEGDTLSLTYGPVVIGWPGVLRKLDYVLQADDPGYRKIGTDLLGTLIIGIDASSDSVYILD